MSFKIGDLVFGNSRDYGFHYGFIIDKYEEYYYKVELIDFPKTVERFSVYNVVSEEDVERETLKVLKLQEAFKKFKNNIAGKLGKP